MGTWTPQRVSRLRRLWAQTKPTLSMAQIAKKMGLSRNAIAGKVDRLQLSSRKKIVAYFPGQRRRKKSPVAAAVNDPSITPRSETGRPSKRGPLAQP